MFFFYSNFVENKAEMKKLKGFSLILFLLFFYCADGQQIVKKDTLKGTVLTETMDARISSLLTELEERCARAKDTENLIVEPKRERVVKFKSKAEICRENPRILGYKIQVALVKSNEAANKIKAEFRARFPNIKAETDASLRPNYKILVGSYLSKQSASGDLSRIKSVFPGAIPVQYRVFCVEAK